VAHDGGSIARRGPAPWTRFPAIVPATLCRSAPRGEIGTGAAPCAQTALAQSPAHEPGVEERRSQPHQRACT
jgi:hypothetical protein